MYGKKRLDFVMVLINAVDFLDRVDRYNYHTREFKNVKVFDVV